MRRVIADRSFQRRQFGEVRWTPVSTASVLFQGVVVSFASYFCWFWLLRRYLANNLAIFSFMTPVRRHLRCIAAGRAAQPELVAGAALVLAGITLVGGEQWLRRLLRR